MGLLFNMRHGSLFSGIGGFDLAAQWMGWENVFHCEINPFCQRVLSYHFPNSIQHHDITKTDFTVYRGKLDILTGGFPCQPFSVAGKQLGTEDDRHLWPEMLRAISEIQPSWIVGENVCGLVNWSGGLVFEQVQTELEAKGYEVLPFILPACAVDAPHRRDRVWFVAYAMRSRHGGITEEGGSDKIEERAVCEDFGQHGNGVRGETKRCGEAIKNTFSDGRIQRELDKEGADIREQRDISAGSSERDGRIGRTGEIGTTTSNPNRNGLQRSVLSDFNQQSPSKETLIEKRLSARRQGIQFQNFPTQSPVCSGDDGISDRLDAITFSKWRSESVKAYGNAVVPPLVLEIFKAIEAHG